MTATFVITLLGSGQPASAHASGNIGRVAGGMVYCLDGVMKVDPPFIEAAPAQTQYGSGFSVGGGSTPAQAVEFRAILHRYIGNSLWTRIQTGPWWWRMTSWENTNIMIGGGSGWFSREGVPMRDVIGFYIPATQTRTYYGVTFEYHWYGDQFRGEGYDFGGAAGYDDMRASPIGTGVVPQGSGWTYCKYPGANWVNW